MNFFTADWHLMAKHKREELCLPNMSDYRYMSILMDGINSRATAMDDLWIIGDYVDCTPDDTEMSRYIEALNCVKYIIPRSHLLLGNNELRVIQMHFGGNEEAFKQACIECGFASVDFSRVIELKGLQFNLVHNYEHGNKKLFNLFGHLHGVAEYTARGINICAPCHYLLPWSEDMIFYKIATVYGYHDVYDYVFKEPFDEDLWQRYVINS